MTRDQAKEEVKFCLDQAEMQSRHGEHGFEDIIESLTKVMEFFTQSETPTSGAQQ